MIPPPPTPQFAPVEVSTPLATSTQPSMSAVVMVPLKTGLAEKTTFPVPVSSVKMLASSSEVSKSILDPKPNDEVDVQTTPLPVDMSM